MKKILVVVDMQNDFIDGALGTAEAVAIVDNAAEKIKNFFDTNFVPTGDEVNPYISNQWERPKGTPIEKIIRPHWG